MCKPAHASTHAWMCVEVRVQFWEVSSVYRVCPWRSISGLQVWFKHYVQSCLASSHFKIFSDVFLIILVIYPYVCMCLCVCHMYVQVATEDKSCWIPRVDCCEPSSLAAENGTWVFVEAVNTLNCGSLILDFWCLFRKAGFRAECPVKG